MRRTFLLACTVLLCAGACAAQSSNVSSTINRSNFVCGLTGSDANGDPIFGGFGTVTNELENKNKIELVCHGSGITNLSGRGQEFSGGICLIFDFDNGQIKAVVATTDSHATVSEDGEAELHCTYKPAP